MVNKLVDKAKTSVKGGSESTKCRGITAASDESALEEEACKKIFIMT
jgi:hypothetical protein